MNQIDFLAKIWNENELSVLARSREAHAEVAVAVRHRDRQAVFAKLLHLSRRPETNRREVIARL